MDAVLFRAIYDWLHRAPWLQIMPWITHLGATNVVLTLAGVCFVESALAQARAQSSLPLLAPWIGVPVAGIVGQIFKRLVHRPRPEMVYPGLGLPHSDGFSFPSGHATLAFALSTALTLRWPKGRYWWYGLATLVALSRVALGAHWPTDVVAGALLGWAVVRIAARVEDAARRRARGTAVR